MFLYINSKDNVNTASNDIMIKIDHDIKGNKIHLIDAIIPRSDYNLTDYNSNFILYESESPYIDSERTQIKITNGSYNIQTLTNQIQETLNTLSKKEITYIVDFSDLKGHITISSDTSNRKFYIGNTDNNIFNVIGYVFGDYFADDEDLTKLNISFESTNHFDLRGMNFIYIMTDMNIESSLHSNSNGDGISCLYKIPLLHNSNDVINYQPIIKTGIRINNGVIPSGIYSIYLIDEFCHPINLNGLHFDLTFAIE
ncbi:MAG: hypothetical protein GQ557_01320 [Mycoplasmataceae bacterium]|nr:hypothetical protein [Mycoplasmataceae bacterium]